MSSSSDFHGATVVVVPVLAETVVVRVLGVEKVHVVVVEDGEGVVVTGYIEVDVVVEVEASYRDNRLAGSRTHYSGRLIHVLW